MKTGVPFITLETQVKLSTAYARFYKSFNFDHARKLDPRAETYPWEMFRGTSYPYVTIPIDRKITTVVGANESGKSHLLGVIKKAITGEKIEPRDLCRYSPFFGVAQGQTCWPHVGVGWDTVQPEETSGISALLDIEDYPFERFLMFREEPEKITAWLPNEENEWTRHDLDVAKTRRFETLLPKPFEINAEIALPNAIPFAFLTHGEAAPAGSLLRPNGGLVDALSQLQSIASGGAAAVQQQLPQIMDLLRPLVQPIDGALDPNRIASLQLGRSLLLDLGEVDQSGLNELAKAIDEQQDGYVGGLLRAVNQQLERKLNFKRYWVQDRDFSLRVSTRDRELVFTISDRTGTEYTFSERSSGLRYFLSYLIQAQVHRPLDGRESILLMDEPDTYLSAEAQQDLMRVFRDLAEPPTGSEPIQVIYVTHSPFLLDKNHSERIRVLEKGTGFDGTRVVPNVSRNHYEPLRSAFGAFVGETAFVGSVNLLVEGAADQVLLAGAASEIRRRSPNVEEDTLDLNNLVVVPCGSAGEIPYTVFRIRGQGADKPPVVVLLDSDDGGRTAAAQFQSDKRLKKLISPDHVLDLGKLGAEGNRWPDIVEIEDLVPIRLAHAAVTAVIAEVTKFREGAVPKISFEALKLETEKTQHLLDAINKLVSKEKGRIEKLPFAKAIVELCRAPPNKELEREVETYLDRMRVIFRAVNAAKRDAIRTAARKRLDALVSDRANLFRIDNPNHATREQGRIALDEIEAQLDDSVVAKAIRNAILPLRRDFQLHDEPGTPIDRYDAFLEGIVGLKHAWAIEAEGTN